MPTTHFTRQVQETITVVILISKPNALHKSCRQCCRYLPTWLSLVPVGLQRAHFLYIPVGLAYMLLAGFPLKP